MIITKIKPNDINKALEEINKKYDDNIKSDSYLTCICNVYPKYKVNLLVKDLNKKGARINLINKINRFACFHVYYDFFNILLEINSNTIIFVCGDWIIKKLDTGEIVGNWNKINKSYISRIKPSALICRCKQNAQII